MTNLKKLFEQATARPWKIISAHKNDLSISYSDGELRSDVATCHDSFLCVEHGTVLANARLITLAANHFEAVVETLEAMQESICLIHCQVTAAKEMQGKHVKVCNYARTVLAAIEKDAS